MTKAELIEKLKDMPDDAQIHLDDDGYAAVIDAVQSNELGFEGDEEDAPPANVILLEVE